MSYVKSFRHIYHISMLLKCEEDTDLTKSLKKKMLDYIKSKDEATEEQLDVASCLDNMPQV